MDTEYDASSPYAMACTDVRCMVLLGWHGGEYGKDPAINNRVVLAPLVSSYGPAMRCLVLTSGMALPGCTG
eukprot:2769611-Rhodomonas_salina.2